MIHKTKRVTVLIYFLLFLFIFSACSKKYGEISVCSESGFVPFEMRNSKGEWDGYDIALIKKFAEETGNKIKFVDMKFDGLIPSLVANRGCDIIVSAVGINSERKNIVLFSDPTYQSAYAGIMRVKDIGKFSNYNDINQDGVKIALQQGTEAVQYVKKNFSKARVLLFEDNTIPIQAVITNKADIYIDDSVYLSIAIKRNIGKLALIKPELLPKNQYSGMGFLFRKDEEDLRDQFNKFFAEIKGNGELNKLQKFYFTDMAWLNKQVTD